MSISEAEMQALKFASRDRDFIASLPYGGQVELLPLKSGNWRAYIRYFVTPSSPRGQETEAKEVVRDGYDNIITGATRDDLVAKLKAEYSGWKWYT